MSKKSPDKKEVHLFRLKHLPTGIWVVSTRTEQPIIGRFYRRGGLKSLLTQHNYFSEHIDEYEVHEYIFREDGFIECLTPVPALTFYQTPAQKGQLN